MIADIEKFKEWIVSRGGEILPQTNYYELLRFKGKQGGIIYKSGKVGNHYTQMTVHEFKSGKKWSGAPVKTGRINNYRKQKIALLERDGCACFYCAELLEDDITVEHLITLVAGGKNNLANMVLAHEACNMKFGVLPISKKVTSAIKIRVEKILKITKP